MIYDLEQYEDALEATSPRAAALSPRGSRQQTHGRIPASALAADSARHLSFESESKSAPLEGQQKTSLNEVDEAGSPVAAQLNYLIAAEAAASKPQLLVVDSDDSFLVNPDVKPRWSAQP